MRRFPVGVKRGSEGWSGGGSEGTREGTLPASQLCRVLGFHPGPAGFGIGLYEVL